jgi:uncharacterized HAD superfamily protein
MEGRKQRLGFDLDGVLYPWQEVIYQYQRYHAGEEHSFQDFWKEATERVFNTKLGDFWLTNNLFYVQRDIRPEILDVIHYLNDIYDVYYITSRVKSARYATKYWFKRNKLPNFDNLYFADGEKLPLVLQHEIDYFVEDRIKHILELKDHTNIILIRQPWNELIWDEVPTLDSVLQLPELLGVENGRETSQ